MNAISNPSVQSLPGFNHACGFYQAIDEIDVHANDLETVQNYNKYSKCSKVSNVCGYFPVLGSFIGCGRIAYAAACCLNHNCITQKQYSGAQKCTINLFYAGHCIRAIPEFVALGCLLTQIDKSCTDNREKTDPTGGLCPAKYVKPLAPVMEVRNLQQIRIAQDSPIKDPHQGH